MVTARKEILNVLSFYNPMGFLTLFQEDKEDKSFEEFKERNKMKYKSVMFLIMSIVLIGSAVGFYEYVNDDGTYYVVEKANLDESLFSDYANIIEEIFHFEDETHIKIIEEEEWVGEIEEYLMQKQLLQEFAEDLDVQGGLESSLEETDYLCQRADNGEMVGCRPKSYPVNGWDYIYICEVMPECE